MDRDQINDLNEINSTLQSQEQFVEDFKYMFSYNGLISLANSFD
jgi:hypothetical protein